MNATREIVQKVAKLLALAAGKGTTPEEAATAAAAAQRLMLRYRIEQAELAQIEDDDPMGATSPTPRERVPGQPHEGFVYQTKRWQIDLLNAIARANGCMSLLSPSQRTGRWLDLVGRRSDLEICKYLWVYLSGEIERSRASQTRGWSQARKAHFCLGVAHTIIGALQRETAEAISTSTGASGALALSSRYDAAKTWYIAQNPSTVTSRSRRVMVDMHAYQSGKAAGAAVSIRKGMTTSAADPRRLLK